MRGRKANYKFKDAKGEIETKRLEQMAEAIKEKKIKVEGFKIGNITSIVYDDGDFDVLTGTNHYFRVYLDRFELWEWAIGGEEKHIHILTF